jgi:hypothetical protein
VLSVERYFDGSYISFPNHQKERSASAEEIKKILMTAADHIGKLNALKTEETLKPVIVSSLRATADKLANEELATEKIEEIISLISDKLPDTPAKTSTIVPATQQVTDSLQAIHTRLSAPDPGDRDRVFDSVLGILPKFVYYSNYGNLDSEIYLPHVVQNLEREDLGAKEAAKARTLRVLFKFVNSFVLSLMKFLS